MSSRTVLHVDESMAEEERKKSIEQKDMDKLKTREKGKKKAKLTLPTVKKVGKPLTSAAKGSIKELSCVSDNTESVLEEPQNGL